MTVRRNVFKAYILFIAHAGWRIDLFHKWRLGGSFSAEIRFFKQNIIILFSCRKDKIALN